MKIIQKEHASGGKGYITVKQLLDAKQLNEKCGLYAEVTITPGNSLGYHEHQGESETYYILQGKGVYDDNGITRTITAGDVTFTSHGMGHGIENKGTEDLVFMALIIFD
ncbi:MAG: cupin domain-containing protein [Megasphaera sp.]|jgi:oxalate decarboxylase/phosphoglucose isomerase-like protein (cupin superfamily)|uniref:cupin domain-containing protein n=1 Tax=Megasphaera sueciensis TaxID=349094 RepID=UPI003D06BC89|nr:cupin domain-containing protein [Megasphaera sp.]MCI1823470.1 cupin domain-containing protein [Megasphaera sp.]